MCGRFVYLEWDDVLDVIQRIVMDTPFNPRPEWPASRRIARPGSVVTVITPESECLKPVDLRWGLAAPWDERKLLFNTRIETALDQECGIWHDAILHGRCIVPTWGFFEPSATETVPSPQTGKPVKRQYEFSLPEGPTLLAGVRNRDAFSVVTTKPSGSVAPVHDRMPVVLQKDEARQWLYGDYAALADRGGIALDVEAEPLPKAPDDRQTSLF